MTSTSMHARNKELKSSIISLGRIHGEEEVFAIEFTTREANVITGQTTLFISKSQLEETISNLNEKYKEMMIEN